MSLVTNVEGSSRKDFIRTFCCLETSGSYVVIQILVYRCKTRWRDIESRSTGVKSGWEYFFLFFFFIFFFYWPYNFTPLVESIERLCSFRRRQILLIWRYLRSYLETFKIHSYSMCRGSVIFIIRVLRQSIEKGFWMILSRIEGKPLLDIAPCLHFMTEMWGNVTPPLSLHHSVLQFPDSLHRSSSPLHDSPSDPDTSLHTLEISGPCHSLSPPHDRVTPDPAQIN